MTVGFETVEVWPFGGRRVCQPHDFHCVKPTLAIDKQQNRAVTTVSPALRDDLHASGRVVLEPHGRAAASAAVTDTKFRYLRSQSVHTVELPVKDPVEHRAFCRGEGPRGN